MVVGIKNFIRVWFGSIVFMFGWVFYIFGDKKRKPLVVPRKRVHMHNEVWLKGEQGQKLALSPPDGSFSCSCSPNTKGTHNDDETKR